MSTALPSDYCYEDMILITGPESPNLSPDERYIEMEDRRMNIQEIIFEYNDKWRDINNENNDNINEIGNNRIKKQSLIDFTVDVVILLQLLKKMVAM